MNIAAHMQKYRQFDDARQRLQPLEDFDLWYWAVSSAGTALINAALHMLGVTRENRHFATQVPDVYAVADSDATWHYELASACDLIHAGIPELPSMPALLKPAFEAMHEIERYRNPCIRGEHPVTPELLRTFEQAYSTVRHVTGTVLEEDLA